MPVITLPDGAQRSFAEPVTALEVARSIGAGLTRSALAARIDEQLCDLSTVIAHDAHVALITERNAEGLEVMRHFTWLLPLLSSVAGCSTPITTSSTPTLPGSSRLSAISLCRSAVCNSRRPNSRGSFSASA